MRLPSPICLVLGGLGLGFVPGIPALELPPQVVFVAVLPPLLYLSAFFTSVRDLRANARSIGILAVGLVVATTVTVAIVAHAAVGGLSWSAAFVLGAVVAPTDPIASTAIMRRLGVPRRLVSIVESESLVNDGTALVLYRVAVVAVVSGTFSIWDASWRFAWSVLGGIAIGLVVGYITPQVRPRLEKSPLGGTVAAMTGHPAVNSANHAHAARGRAAVT